MEHEELSPTWIMRASSLLLLLSGALRGVVGVQLVVFVRLGGRWWWVPYAMMALGALVGLTGALASRGRARPVIAGAALGPLAAALGIAWEVYAIPRGLLSPLSVCASGAALLSAVAAPMAVRPALAIQEARRRLLA